MNSEFSYSLLQVGEDSVSVAETLSVINELTRASRWKSPQFAEALKQSSLSTFVAKVQSEIIGYAIFSVVPPEAHLVNIAIAPTFQRQGVGISFLSFCLSILQQKAINECWLEVRESNLVARNFYKKANFSDVQIRKDFYDEPKEDAWLMMAKLESLSLVTLIPDL